MNLRSKKCIAPNLATGADLPPPNPVPIQKGRRTPKPLILEQQILEDLPKTPRNYARGAWTMKQMEDCIASIEDGVFSIRKAAMHFGIPQTTVRNHLDGISTSKFGSTPRGLTPTEEADLLEWAFKLGDEGRPVTLEVMRQKVAEMTANRPTIFKDGLPGSKWWHLFKKRHPEVTIKSAQGVEFNRVKAMTSSNLSNFYSTLKNCIDTLGLDASRVWNADETGVQAGFKGSMRVIARKSDKHPHQNVPTNREWLSLLVCVNAQGVVMPGLYVFKGKRMRDVNVISGCEPGAVMSFQKSAWITDALFQAWIDHFRKHVPGGITIDRPHLLICDGHGSHVTLDTVMKAKEFGLHILQLPPHTSHRLQPLDVACFGPFKGYFKKSRADFMSRSAGMEPSKEDLATIVSKSMKQALSPNNVKAGFEKTGIWPFDDKAVSADPKADEIQAARQRKLEELKAAKEVDIPADLIIQGKVLEALAEAASKEGPADPCEDRDAEAEVHQDAREHNVPTSMQEDGVEEAGNQQPITEEQQQCIKKRAKGLRLPESLKNRLYVSHDEVISARLEHKKKFEEAEAARLRKLEEKKKQQAARKEAREMDKRRREENKKAREEKKRQARERAVAEREEEVGDEAACEGVRPKRIRKKSRRYIEYEELSDEESEVQMFEQSGENVVGDSNKHEDKGPQVSAHSDRTCHLEVALNMMPMATSDQVDAIEPTQEPLQPAVLDSQLPPEAMLQDSQIPDSNENMFGCSLEETHICSWDELMRKKKVYPHTNTVEPIADGARDWPSPNEIWTDPDGYHGRGSVSESQSGRKGNSDSQSDSAGICRKTRNLDELYRAQANAHLGFLGL